MMRLVRRFWSSSRARTIGGVAVGAVAGALYSHYVGCLTGSCPLTSNPLLTAVLGAALGASLLTPDRTAKSVERT